MVARRFHSLVHRHLESDSRARPRRNFRKIAKTPHDGEVFTFCRDLIKTFASFVALRNGESSMEERGRRGSRQNVKSDAHT